MAEQHTPAPWHVLTRNSGGIYVFGVTALYPPGPRAVVADVRNLDHDQGSPEANAHLIQAAPDLLEACQRGADYLKLAGYDTDSLGACEHEILPMLHNAIRKAYGKKKQGD